MPTQLHISLNIANRALQKLLVERCLNQPGIEISRGQADLPLHDCAIIFIEDVPETGNILDKVRVSRRHTAKVHIFVISTDPSPDHIIATMKAGASEYFLAPLNIDKVREAIERVRLHLLPGGKDVAGAAYAFIGSKGGLGTTVLAVNTAMAMAGEKTGRTALFDLSLAAGDSSILLDLAPKTTIADIARNFDRLDASFLASAMERHAAGVDLLAAPVNMEEGGAITTSHIERVIQLLRSQYGTVVIDCPALSIDDRILTALRPAEKVIVVTDLSLLAIRNTARLVKFLGQSGLSAQKVEVVVNRMGKGQTGAVEDVEKSVGKRVFWLFPNDFDCAVGSANRGAPLLKYDPRSALARSIGDFSRKLTEPTAFLNYRGIKGLLGKAI